MLFTNKLVKIHISDIFAGQTDVQGNLLNPLSPNVADLQNFDIVLFCGFSLCNAFCPSTELFTESLLVVRLSQGLVKKAG